MDEEKDLEQLFSKHKYQNNSLIKVKFTEDEIKSNLKVLENYNQRNLIKTQAHFISDDERELFDQENLDEINYEKSQSSQDPNNKSSNSSYKENYFKKLIEETREGGLYCSYMDSFDKMWISNSN